MFFNDDFFGGTWWLIKSIFLRTSARASYQKMLTRKVLEVVPFRRFMAPDPLTVRPGMAIDGFVEDYINKYHYKIFPVVGGARIMGCITTKEIK